MTLREQINTRMLTDLRALYAGDQRKKLDEGSVAKVIAKLIRQDQNLELNQDRALQGMTRDVLDAMSRLEAKLDLSLPRKIGTDASHGAVKGMYGSKTGDLAFGMDDLAPAFSKLADESDQVAMHHCVLRSLGFGQMTMRYHQIHPAHAKTYEWILEDEGLSASSFKRWLTMEKGVFWISGKAGSGKSTLMRLLTDHNKTFEALYSWAGSRRLVVAKFFFWNAGRDLQKTQDGLLRTLLFEI